MSEQPDTCQHTNELGTCTLPKGHTWGHHDETNDRQWWSREDEHGTGAYASILPGDPMYRHEHGKCNGPIPPRAGEVEWCPWCLRAERDALRVERDELREALEEISGMPAYDRTAAAMREVADEAPGDEDAR